MKILWITNIMLPPICEAMNLPSPVVGGWLYSSAKRIYGQDSITLSVATVYSGKDFIHKSIEGINYFLLPLNGKNNQRYNKELESYWKQVNDITTPDVVHLHGTEFAHGLAYIRSCGSNNVAVSIQGLTHVYYYYYYYGGIEAKTILQNITFRDIVRRDSIIQQQRKFEKRGDIEKEILRSVNHIIGRTEWDKAHTWTINPDAQYHYCGETLRDSFYTNKWEYCNCTPHTIFLSQAGYPLKGLHQVLKAMPLILRHFPDTHINVAGEDIIRKPWYRLSGYGKYIKSLINKYDLNGHITFTGSLNEQQICQQYLCANLFICPSCIENSPNSLGEAQMLGMPYLSAYVGGAPDLVEENTKALYRFEETSMLAKKICDLFTAKENAATTATKRILNRYDAAKNTDRLIAIYNEIAKG